LLGLDISTATAKSGLCFVYTISSLPLHASSTVLYLITLYIFIKTSFPLETTINDPSNEEKPDRKPYPSMVVEIHAKQSTNENNSSLFTNIRIAIC
jgi:hypothetical protein